MSKNFGVAPALKKNKLKLTRRILVGAGESERRPLLDDVKRLTRVAVDNTKQIIHELRKSYAVSLPNLIPEWDVIPTENPSPSHTIAAFDGDKSEIRVTVQLGNLTDDTTTVHLEGCGISHLIGVSAGEATNTWQVSEGGMIALINTDISLLSELLEDILLDMAMIHAKSRPWSGIRDQLSSSTIAMLKVRFVQQTNRLASLPYISSGEAGYFPLASFARDRTKPQQPTKSLNLSEYVVLWSDFALFAKREANIQLNTDKTSTSQLLLESHIAAARISETKLTKQIAALTPGHYCLYFLVRKARAKKKVAQLCSFFRISPKRFHTQRWVIYEREKRTKEASAFLYERYISVFPFYVSESDE